MGGFRCGLCILSNVRRKNGGCGCLIARDGGNQRNTPRFTSLCWKLLWLEVEGVLDGDVIARRQGSEAVDTLHGPHGRQVERGGAAAGLDAGVRGDTFAVDVEDNGGALAEGGAGIRLSGVPV